MASLQRPARFGVWPARRPAQLHILVWKRLTATDRTIRQCAEVARPDAMFVNPASLQILLVIGLTDDSDRPRTLPGARGPLKMMLNIVTFSPVKPISPKT